MIYFKRLALLSPHLRGELPFDQLPPHLQEPIDDAPPERLESCHSLPKSVRINTKLLSRKQLLRLILLMKQQNSKMKEKIKWQKQRLRQLSVEKSGAYSKSGGGAVSERDANKSKRKGHRVVPLAQVVANRPNESAGAAEVISQPPEIDRREAVTKDIIITFADGVKRTYKIRTPEREHDMNNLPEIKNTLQTMDELKYTLKRGAAGFKQDDTFNGVQYLTRLKFAGLMNLFIGRKTKLQTGITSIFKPIPVRNPKSFKVHYFLFQINKGEEKKYMGFTNLDSSEVWQVLESKYFKQTHGVAIDLETNAPYTKESFYRQAGLEDPDTQGSILRQAHLKQRVA